MRICFIADASSIHARCGVEYFCKLENEAFVLSTLRNPQPIEEVKVYDLYGKKMVTLDGRYVVAKGKIP